MYYSDEVFKKKIKAHSSEIDGFLKVNNLQVSVSVIGAAHIVDLWYKIVSFYFKGLAEAARKSFIVSKTSSSKLNHPRTYSLTPNGDTKGFIRDFNLTAAMSLLKWVQTNSVTRQCKIISHSGKISLGVFDFAVSECYKLIKKAENLGKGSKYFNETLNSFWSYLYN